MGGGLGQERLHHVLRQLLRRSLANDPFSERGSWFAITEEAMLDLYQPMNELASSLARLAHAGQRDAEQYFTLHGHLQMWCDSNGWEWWHDEQLYLWRFGKVVGAKILLNDTAVRVHAWCEPPGGCIGAYVHERIREPRPYERHVKGPDGKEVSFQGDGRQRVRFSDLEKVVDSLTKDGK